MAQSSTTASKRQQRTTIRMMIHHPLLVSGLEEELQQLLKMTATFGYVPSVSCMNFFIFFIAPPSLFSVRSTPASKSLSILWQRISAVKKWRETINILVMFANFTAHQTSLFGQRGQSTGYRRQCAILLPDHDL